MRITLNFGDASAFFIFDLPKLKKHEKFIQIGLMNSFISLTQNSDPEIGIILDYSYFVFPILWQKYLRFMSNVRSSTAENIAANMAQLFVWIDWNMMFANDGLQEPVMMFRLETFTFQSYRKCISNMICDSKSAPKWTLTLSFESSFLSWIMRMASYFGNILTPSAFPFRNHLLSRTFIFHTNHIHNSKEEQLQIQKQTSNYRI